MRSEGAKSAWCFPGLGSLHARPSPPTVAPCCVRALAQAPDRTFSQSGKVGSSRAKGDSLVCAQPLFQIGDKTIRTFEDLAKYFSL